MVRKSSTSQANAEVRKVWEDAIEFTNNLELHSLVNGDNLYQSYIHVMAKYHLNLESEATTVHARVKHIFSAHLDFWRTYARLCAINPDTVHATSDNPTPEPNAIPSSSNEEPKPKSSKSPAEENKRPREDNVNNNNNNNDDEPKPKRLKAPEENKRRGEDNTIMTTRRVFAKITEDKAVNFSIKVSYVEEKRRLSINEAEEERLTRPCSQSHGKKGKFARNYGIEMHAMRGRVLRDNIKWRPELCTPSYGYLAEVAGPSKAPKNKVLNTTCGICIREVESRGPPRSREQLELDEMEDIRFEREMELLKDPIYKKYRKDLLKAAQKNLPLYRQLVNKSPLS